MLCTRFTNHTCLEFRELFPRSGWGIQHSTAHNTSSVVVFCWKGASLLYSYVKMVTEHQILGQCLMYISHKGHGPSLPKMVCMLQILASHPPYPLRVNQSGFQWKNIRGVTSGKLDSMLGTKSSRSPSGKQKPFEVLNTEGNLLGIGCIDGG